MNTPEKAKIVTTWNGLGWTAVRDDYDLGMAVGTSIASEEEAIADLIEWEEMLEDGDDELRYLTETGAQT
jgi:hypothetical protein